MASLVTVFVEDDGGLFVTLGLISAFIISFVSVAGMPRSFPRKCMKSQAIGMRRFVWGSWCWMPVARMLAEMGWR